MQGAGSGSSNPTPNPGVHVKVGDWYVGLFIQRLQLANVTAPTLVDITVCSWSVPIMAHVSAQSVCEDSQSQQA